MRLTPLQQAFIKQTLKEVCPQATQVLLFGSRVDDQAKGGDVDLMIDGDSSHQNDSPIKQKEYELIVQTLEQFDGHRQKVAEALGISARTLRYKMAKMRDAGFVL